ncbi:hypothetical protein [Luteimonas sp. FCS-9]|uniref:hypothetical protein n=1 Tax=Luteimonas sp. FCS-9 TaxID=1547516 RepID=UPI00063EB220|nr:hypothetical protein [Luteimonas sp. FCS-9]KLJ02916.1 hypothetical protein WQ56_01210 [Luteimonas sp. FCS-9]
MTSIHTPPALVDNARTAAPDAYAALSWVEEFVELARLAIDEHDDEVLRRRYEDEVLRRAVYLRAAGLFDIVQIRHPALRAMVADAR